MKPLFHLGKRRRSSLGIVACVMATLTASCEAPQQAARFGKVTDDWRLRELSSGQQVALDSLKGKVLFINVWATWCGPCREELPSIAQLYERYQNNPNVAFLLVSVDDSLSDVEEFVAREKITVPVYTGLSPIPRELATEGIPATFILDGERNIHKRHIGYYDWNNPNTSGLIDRLAGKS